MTLTDQEESSWAEALRTYEKAVATALKEIDEGRPQDAADALRQAGYDAHQGDRPIRPETVPPSICGDPNQTRADRTRVVEGPRQNLEAIRERLDAATPGPWATHKTHSNAINLRVVTSRESPTSHTVCGFGRWPLEHDEANAEFVAHAPEDIEHLLDLVVEMRDSVASLRSAAATAPLTELCEEHVDPWQEWFDEYKRVMEVTEKHTRPADESEPLRPDSPPRPEDPKDWPVA